MKNIIPLITALLILAVSSCNKDKTGASAPTTKGVYITNEGNYNFGNGEVSFYDPSSQLVSNDIFKGVNHYSLGDVVQSMFIKDSTGFIVVNNSAKIEVVKIPSLQHILTITIPNSSPRYFLPINDSVAYVTDIYGFSVHVINYHTGHLITNITGLAKWTEHLLLVNGTVVVEERNFSDSTTCSIATINPANNIFIHRYLFAGSSVDGLVSDNQNRIWLGVDADTAHQIPASIACLNTDFSINKKIAFNTGRTISNLRTNGAGTEIYYVDNTGVGAISVNDTIPPANPLIPVNGRNLYGMGVDPNTGDIYVSDALDYVQQSKIFRYNKQGNLLQSFKAGIISGNFAFSN